MPEYAELHATAHLCADAGRGFSFTSATIDTHWSLPCSLPQHTSNSPDGSRDEQHIDEGHVRLLPGTETWQNGFELCARHRGKEVCLALRKLNGDGGALRAPPPPHSWCPTCAAVADDDEGSVAPLCAGHREACQVQTVRRPDSRHLGRRFWSCGRGSAKARCSYFRWASPSPSSKDADFFPAAEAADREGLLLVTLRRGMHGRCVLLRPGDVEPQGVHLRFVRNDGATLCFVDARVRSTSTGVWQFGSWGGDFRRSPDPVYEYEAFRERALALLVGGAAAPVRDAATVLAAPVCETLLDQRLFNGVGNYLRAEIMYRAKLRPFDSSRVALERADRSPTDILRVTREVLSEAVEKKGRDWLNVYRKAYAMHEVDGLGRAVWYRGERGPLPSTVYEAEGAWDSLFFARLPEAIDRAALQALCARFGRVEHVTFNAQRHYAFVRFQAVESATAAVRALNRLHIFGAELHVRYKRRLRKLPRTTVLGEESSFELANTMASTMATTNGSVSSDVSSAASTILADDVNGAVDEEELMAEEDVEDAHVGLVIGASVTPPAPPAPQAPGPEARVAEKSLHQERSLDAKREGTMEFEDGDDDDDEWDEPISAVQSEPSTVCISPQDPFSRSIRCFRAAGVLSRQIQTETPRPTVSAAAGDECVDTETGLDFLRNLAKSLNQQAERELKRSRLS